MEKRCEACQDREYCQTPCKEVNAILWKNNHVMEKHYSDTIVVFPESGKERHFSELTDKQLDEISEIDVFPWSSGNVNFTQTGVFIDRFFNRMCFKDIADKYRVKENTAVIQYKNAVEALIKNIEALDQRREGFKCVVNAHRFTDEQKYFLLVAMFGFSGNEVAQIFNRDRGRVNMKVKRLTDKYAAAFSEKNICPIGQKEEIPIDDPPITDKLTREDIIRLVDAYAEQGLSNLKAFKRIADRQGELLGRPVNPKAIASRYQKAMAAKKNISTIVEKSA